jgi:hypothetical protein
MILFFPVLWSATLHRYQQNNFITKGGLGTIKPISSFRAVPTSEPVLPDGILQTKNPNLGKFWKVLQCKMLAFLFPLCLF